MVSEVGVHDGEGHVPAGEGAPGSCSAAASIPMAGVSSWGWFVGAGEASAHFAEPGGGQQYHEASRMPRDCCLPRLPVDPAPGEPPVPPGFLASCRHKSALDEERRQGKGKNTGERVVLCQFQN